MSEILNDLLDGRVNSSEIINWLIGPGTLNYTATKDAFISHFLTWLHGHVTHAVPSEANVNDSHSSSYHGNRPKGTPNRKRADRRRGAHARKLNGDPLSPGGASSQKGGRTPKSCNKTPQTPFRDSLSSLTDYPPLSSSTPVEDPVSRITNNSHALTVKRRVDFSHSFTEKIHGDGAKSVTHSESSHDSKTTQDSRKLGKESSNKCEQNVGVSKICDPSSPPIVRRVGPSPTPICRQVSTRSTSLNQTPSFPNQTSNITDQGSLASSFNKLSNTHFYDRGQNLDFQTSVTPIKPDVTPTKLDVGERNGIDIRRENVSNEISWEKNLNWSVPNDVMPIKSQSKSNCNNVSILSKSAVVPQKKKKAKRVPLMTISNHAKPNWAEKPESITEIKSYPSPCKLDVGHLDSRFSDRLGGPNNGNFNISGFEEKSGLEVPKVRKSFDCVNGIKPLSTAKTITPKSLTNGSCTTPSQCHGITNSSSTSDPIPSSSTSTRPARRLALQPAKPECSFIKNTSDPSTTHTAESGKESNQGPWKSCPQTDVKTVRRVSLDSTKQASNQRNCEDSSSFCNVNKLCGVDSSSFDDTSTCELVGSNKSTGNSAKPIEEVSEVKNKERELAYSLAEIYTILLNEVLVCNLASELQLLLSLIKSASSKISSPISRQRIFFITTVFRGLDVWLRHLSPMLLTEIEKHIDIKITRLTVPTPLFASDISIASVPFQLNEDTRPQFPNDRVFHVFKRIRDSFHSLLRDWEDGHATSHSWSTEQVLGERMKSLMNQKLQLAIFTHFSKLFISLLLKRYKADLCDSPGDTSDKLKKLQTRLLESDKMGSKLCGPATFPKSQDFFKTFIVVSQNYSLNKHLTDHLIGKITELNHVTKSWFTDSFHLDQSDIQEDFSWNLLSIQLLGKFLGLVWYMPYYTTQKIPPTVLTTLRKTRTEPFPLDLEFYLQDSISGGTLTLTVPWVCEILIMMDAVCATLKKSRAVLETVNNLYNQLTSLPVRAENKVLLLFKVGRVMELLVTPHGYFTVNTTEQLNYEPSLDALPLVNTTLLYACCPWLSVLQQAILKQPPVDPIPSTPTKLLPVTTGNKTSLQLRENFFHHQPHTVRKVCEFVCERVHAGALADVCATLTPHIRSITGDDIKAWIDEQDSKDLLEQSLNSRLQFFLSTLVCKICETFKDRCSDQFLKFCQQSCDRLMVDLLPPNTQECVVAVATRLTVNKAREKCGIWWNTMAMSFVEREVQQIAEVHVKHVLSEIGDSRDQERELGFLLLSLDDILLGNNDDVLDVSVCSSESDGVKLSAAIMSEENLRISLEKPDVKSTTNARLTRLIYLTQNTVINKENSHLFLELSEQVVNVLIRYVSEESASLRGSQTTQVSDVQDSERLSKSEVSIKSRMMPRDCDTAEFIPVNSSGMSGNNVLECPPRNIPVSRDLLEPVFQLLLLLRDKKGLETPLTKLPSKSFPIITKSSDSSRKFREVCLKLIYIGVLSPPRLEHWLLWFLESCNFDIRSNVIILTDMLISEYFELKDSILSGKVCYIPGVACFVKQYIVSDFEILKRKLKSIKNHGKN